MKKILLIRFSSIGDIVLTTPVIRALKQQLNDVELHFLSKKEYVSLLKNNPYLSKIHHFESNLNEIIPSLKEEHFDLIIDLHKNLRSKLVIRKLKIKSLTFNKLNFEKWLMVRFKINHLPKKHLVDRYFEAFQELGIKNDGQGLDYFEGEENTNSRQLLPETFQNKYIAFALAGTYFTKKIPFEKWVELASLAPHPILLLGGKSEEELAAKICNQVKDSIIFNACGKYNLNQSAAFIRDAETVVTGDTGLMHIAAAYQKKILSIWGNTIPDFGMYPYIPQKPENAILIQNPSLKCRPCSKLGFDKCPKKHFDCMMKLDLSNVFLQK
jgi:ADP-heptose:LPS heptosyltransferase